MENNHQSVAIMFSGGTDSLALMSMAVKKQLPGLEKLKQVHLMYMLNGMSRYPSFPRERFKICKELLKGQYGSGTDFPELKYVEIDSARLFQGLWLDHYEELMPRYNGKNMVCVACKIAMHAQSIVYCKRNKISTFLTGYAKKQSYYPEQTPTFMNRLKEFSKNFDIETLYPVFEMFTDETVSRHYLEDNGLPSTGGGERACMFSQTYTTAEESDTEKFLNESLPQTSKYLKAILDNQLNVAASYFPPGRVKGKLINNL